jgi:pteridine reductase
MAAALVTGGANRLGKAMALFLADKGYDIALHYWRSVKEAQQTAEEISKKGVKVELFAADLFETQHVAELLPRVAEKVGPLEVMINSASIFEKISLMDTTIEDYQRNFAIHLQAPLFLTQLYAKIFQKGLIVNMLDRRIEQNETSHFVYTMSKKALRDLTLLSSRELAPEIRVNGICPGAILKSEQESSQEFQALVDRSPLKRAGEPSNILMALSYLLENQMVTGQMLFVDGGQHLT